MVSKLIAAAPAITAAFEPYGWFLAPYVMGSEFARLEQLSLWIQANPPSNDADRKSIEEKIGKELEDVAFSSQIRARSIWLGLQTQHFNEYSHVYESAIFSFYKREYPAAVVLMLTALEGIILSLSGWRLGQPAKPTFSQLTQVINNITPFNFNDDLNAWQNTSRTSLFNFVSEWLYKSTPAADFSLSVLNRHYVLHGFEPGNFYRTIDVHRLILAFDLLIDVVSMSQGIFHAVLEDDEVKYNEREEYFRALQTGNISIGTIMRREEHFLRQHPNFVPPA